SPVDVVEMESRISEIVSELPWLVFEDNKQILGYSFASHWKSRCAYRYSVESTVYVSPSFTNRNIETQLYAELINVLSEKNFHSVIGGIASPNHPSIKLHEKFGFEKVAQFKEVGWKFEKWIDVGYWQLKLNSNAKAVGNII
ncbi:MAG: GNAT family N-acetyltransferase, partial [Chitinispirillia bacterium]